MESELESARCLTHEVERALHAELSALRAQVTKVSHQLLEEDAETAQIKEQVYRTDPILFATLCSWGVRG